MDAPIHAAVVSVLGDFLLSPAARHHLESQGLELKPGLNGSGRSRTVYAQGSRTWGKRQVGRLVLSSHLAPHPWDSDEDFVQWSC